MSYKDVGKTTEKQDSEIEEFDRAFDELAAGAENDGEDSSSKNDSVDEKDATDEKQVEKPASVVQPHPDAAVHEAKDSVVGDESGKANDGSEQHTEKDSLIAELESVRAELERERQRTSSWAGRISAANKRAEQSEKRAAELEAKLKEYQSQAKGKETLPDDDDELALSTFLKEFPDLEKPLRALIRKEAGVKTRHEKEPVQEKEKAVDTAQAADSDLDFEAEQAHIEHWRRIRAKHGDLFNTDNSMKDLPAFERWIASQPTLIQKQFQGYVKSGTTDDIIEMLDLYKDSIKSHNQTSKQNLQQRTDDLEAVEHRPGSPPQGKSKKDKNDFDGAWDEFTKNEN